MTWASGGLFDVQIEKLSDNTVFVGINTAVPVGDVVIIGVASDNTSSPDGDNSEVSGVTDTRGNIYLKAREHTNAQGGAATGATISVWYSQITTALQVNDDITATFVSNRTAKAISVKSFTIGAGNIVSVQAGASLSNDGADPGSMDLTVPNEEFLWVRVIANEGIENATTWTRTAAYSNNLPFGNTTGGGDASNMSIGGEFDIFTGISNPSDPTWTPNRDRASVLIAFKEAAPPAGANTFPGWYGESGWF